MIKINQKNKRYFIGKYSEYLTRLILILKGYKILTKNFKTGKGTNAGEIDIIALKNKTICFIEVKTRQNIETAANSISQKQQQRISKGAMNFLKKNPQYSNYNCRFDAFLISYKSLPKHIKNAWFLN